MTFKQFATNKVRKKTDKSVCISFHAECCTVLSLKFIAAFFQDFLHRNTAKNKSHSFKFVELTHTILARLNAFVVSSEFLECIVGQLSLRSCAMFACLVDNNAQYYHSFFDKCY
jgi:hypothetical protein